MVATARTGHDGRPRVKRAAEELLQSLHRIVAIVEVPWVDVNDEVAQPQPYAGVPPLRHRLCGIIDRHRIDDTPSLAGCLADLATILAQGIPRIQRNKLITGAPEGFQLLGLERGHLAGGGNGINNTEAAHSKLFNLGRTRSEEHTSELQSLMRTSYAVFCLKKKNNKDNRQKPHQ